jgi:putative PIN family toxin of toxin-antitoxin system
VLGRKKFDRYLLPEERERFLARLVLEATLIEVTVHIQVCRDPKDDKVLELAVSSNAMCIISGDQDLLELNPFQNIPILTPAEFLSPQTEEL